MTDDTVWTFWEGPALPYIELCAETVRRHAPRSCRLDAASFAAMRTEPVVDLTHLRLNHQADYIRAYLLRTHGGMWLDADCIVFAPLEPFLDALRICDYIGYREETYQDSQLGLMVARAGGRIITRHYDKVLQSVHANRDPEWLTLSSWPMNQSLDEEGYQGYLQLDRHTIAPIGWQRNNEFFVERSDAEHDEIFDCRAACYMLYNYMVPGWFKDLSRDEVLSGPTFLSYLFRRALAGPGSLTRR